MMGFIFFGLFALLVLLANISLWGDLKELRKENSFLKGILLDTEYAHVVEQLNRDYK